eukprot:scaffold25309_cov176-Skeletonema_marinoi.AAC.3
MASSGHLRRCSEAYSTNKCLSRDKDASILSWPPFMVLTAVPNWASSGHLRRCSDAYSTNKCLCRDKDASIPYYIIMAFYYGSLEAVDCHVHSVRRAISLPIAALLVSLRS